VAISPQEHLSANLAAGMPAYTAEALVELYAERRAGRESHVSPVAERLLGRWPHTFQDFALRHAAVFQGLQPVPGATPRSIIVGGEGVRSMPVELTWNGTRGVSLPPLPRPLMSVVFSLFTVVMRIRARDS
jgi:hypothetical protein